jgi:thioester reductase-like protein
MTQKLHGAMIEPPQTSLADRVAADLTLLPGTLLTHGATAERPLDRILLTGATGFIGVHLVDALLRSTSAVIHCLVRAEHAEAGMARLETAMRGYGLETRELAARVVLETGDLAAPRCGLRAPRWEAIVEGTDAVLHNGAQVNFVAPYHQLCAANVSATRHLLQLAAQAACRFVHISTTMAVTPAGGIRQLGRERVFEHDPPPPVDALGGGYGQSKWAAERLVELAAAAGLPASILRVGTVIGDVRSGRRPPYQLQARLAAASMAAGLLPALTGSVDLVPVEYVSAATVALLIRVPISSGVFHLVNPQALTAVQWQAAVQRLGLPLRILPLDDWLAAMREAARATPQHPLASLVRGATLGTGLRELQQGFPVYDCSRTVAALAGTDIVCPPPSDTLVARLLQMRA